MSKPDHSSPPPVSAPSRSALLLESRAALDAARMLGPLVGAAFRRPARSAKPKVVVVPGFGASDHYTAPLRYFLKKRGFRSEGWGLGRNMAGVDLPHTLADLSPRWAFTHPEEYRGEASVPYLCDRLIDRLQARHGEDGEPLALIGWSLGGFLAREAARELTGLVDRVITLGSPVVGGPKYTAAARFFRKRGMNLDWIEEEIGKRDARPIPQPVTVIYSKSDAIVDWRAALDRVSPRARHIEVNAAHLGLVYNPTVWSYIIEALEAPAGEQVA